MVSVVCSNALNRSVNEFGLRKTGEILDKTRELVLDTFSKGSSDVKDGMDISLLSVNMMDKKIEWSGANNQLWYISNNTLKEITADKQAIGKTDNPKPFTTHNIEFNKGDIFYLMTDGYPDQFGGPKGKKFKYKQLQEILIANSSLELKQQQQILDEKFKEWVGNLEQVDDVSIIGIKI
jgi:serine phosphatase RsbU (regulator of sigma subunit)